MASITTIAEAFFAACDAGQGWEACSAYCTPSATFRAQAEPLLEVKTLAQYTDWMKGMMTVLPDGRYEVKSFATDAVRNNVAVYSGISHMISASHEVPPSLLARVVMLTSASAVWSLTSWWRRSISSYKCGKTRATCST